MEMDQGGMWHTIRAADGSWLQFGDIRGQAGSPGSFVDCSISGNNDTGELHAAGSTSDGRLWHTIRQESGAWLQFGDVTGQAGAPGSFGAVAIGLIGGELHVAGITTTDQKLWHTIRRANGSWGRFADVGGQAGSPGSFADVSIAGNNGTGELHVVGSTSDGSVWHTIRDGSGSWLPFGDVTAQAGTPGSFGHVAIGLVGSDLHVTGVTAADQKVWHTIRDGDGNWDRFGCGCRRRAERARRRACHQYSAGAAGGTVVEQVISPVGGKRIDDRSRPASPAKRARRRASRFRAGPAREFGTHGEERVAAPIGRPGVPAGRGPDISSGPATGHISRHG